MIFLVFVRPLCAIDVSYSKPDDVVRFMERTLVLKSYPFSEFRDDPRFPHVRTIRTKIRGVTKWNDDDGLDRQQIIRQCCESGDALYLQREPNNPVDRNAIRVRRIVCSDVPDKPRLAEQIGYLSRELAEDLAPMMDDHGHVLMAKILEVTGHHTCPNCDRKRSHEKS